MGQGPFVQQTSWHLEKARVRVMLKVHLTWDGWWVPKSGVVKGCFGVFTRAFEEN